MGEIATFINGRAYSQDELLSSGKYKVLRVGNFYTNDSWYYSDMELDDKYYAENGDLLYTWSATFGPHIWRGDKVIYHYHIWKIELSQHLEKRFAVQLLEQDKAAILSDKNGSTMVHITKAGMEEKAVLIPQNIDEQVKIGTFLNNLDNLITLHQREYFSFDFGGGSAKNVQKTLSWEQREFGELVVIERGGSPRPIDDYITDSPDGLNWVKIGDAPEQGNYITSTKEKIKPEGLSKTREVHPGDLILSNSMSFGKPYIMAIDGCIHDGWLSIKNTNNVFDLKFLCVLLGTDQMLTQYKSMAAGSTVNNLNKELVGNTTVTYPNIEEQRTIGQFFEKIESLITLHQHKPNKKGHDVLTVMPFKGNQRKPHYLCT